MILPIYAYGYSVLKKVAKPIEKDHENFDELLKNMWDTMYNANGVGLAGPQVGKSIRIFLDELKKGIKKVFINAEILEETGDSWAYEEGCLSIPQIRGDVERQKKIKIKYLDENFEEYVEEYEGINARVIQHEYDHIEGKLFTEKLKPLKKKMIKRKLEKIKAGKVGTEYRMKFPG
ncbi:UNVERIFIED_CONTAM: hypothetical protein GTU68_049451 [Idotea baltica]|nr:hypothetical protein [Idotea baltica]